MVIAFVSPNSMASVNCRREINFALSKEKPFFSVVLEPTEMPLGMELQLSAQQSVLRHNYAREAAFLEKICACPDLACCRETPVLQSESRGKTVVAESTQIPYQPVTAQPPVKEKEKKTPGGSGKTLGILAGIAVVVILAAVMVFSSFGKKGPEKSSASAAQLQNAAVQETADTYLVHAQVPKLWGRVDLWAWSAADGREAFDAQPGATMEADEDGWYTAAVPAWADSLRINGNYATMETPDIRVEGREVWIVINEDLTYQMSYEGPFTGTVTVRAQISDDWQNVYCWAWGKDADAFDAWPGEPMMKDGDWYAVQVPNWITGIIITDEVYQSGDFTVDAGYSIWIVERDGWWVAFYEEPTEAQILEAFADIGK